MAVMQHPLFSDVTQTVADADVSTWQKQGWTRADDVDRERRPTRDRQSVTDRVDIEPPVDADE